MLTIRKIQLVVVLGSAWSLFLLLLPPVAQAAIPQLLSVDPKSGPPGTAVTVTGTGWTPDYYASGVRISFYQNFGNGVLTKYADDKVVKADGDGNLSFPATIPTSFTPGSIVTFSGLIGNGSGADANFTVTAGPSPQAKADLQPTSITFDQLVTVVGKTIHFDSGVTNGGTVDTGIFNIKWLVDGKDVGAYGSHAGIAAGATVMDGNSQFDWNFDKPYRHVVRFIVDADNHIAEANERNNEAVITLDVAPPPSAALPVGAVDAARNLVDAYNKICSVAKCKFAPPSIDQVLAVIGKAAVVVDLARVGYLGTVIGGDIKQFNAASVGHAPGTPLTPAQKAAFDKLRTDTQTLISIIPGLEFLFPPLAS